MQNGPAGLPESPVTFKAVFDQELLQIQKGRDSRKVSDSADLDDIRGSLIGLALSGGGIRSATFNLGVLQSLAKNRLLHTIDYMSSVSGGGYIAGWLKALTRRYLETVPNATFEDVENALRPEQHSPDQRRERPFVHWLRLYSSYLTPNRSPVSGDSWSMISTWRRNATLNQLVLLLASSSAFVFIFFVLHALEYIEGLKDHGYVLLQSASLLTGSLTAVLIGLNVIKGDMPKSPSATRGMRILNWAITLSPVCSAVFLNTFLEVCAPQSGSSWWHTGKPSWPEVAIFAGIGAAFYVVPTLPAIRSVRFGTVLMEELIHCVVGAIGGLLVWAYMQALPFINQGGAGKWISAVLGPAILVEILVNTGILRQGVTGSLVTEFRRERWARVGGYVTLTTLAWLLLAGVMVFGPLLVRWSVAMGANISVSAVILWILTTWGGLMAAKSEKVGGDQVKEILTARVAQKIQGRIIGLLKSPLALDGIAKVAPYVFALGSLLLLATTIHVVFGALSDPGNTRLLWWDSVRARDHDLSSYWTILNNASPLFLALTFVLLGMAACLLSRRVDINDFSLHNFYRNRLVRAYLGASVPDRIPEPSTKLSAEDDLPLSCFQALTGQASTANADGDYDDPGPYPIFNAALNISSGSELGYSKRRAKSFFFTPLYCGYEENAPDRDRKSKPIGPTGDAQYPNEYWFASPPSAEGAFCKTFASTELGRAEEHQSRSSSRGGITLGTAMAVSGAAASPNMGYHSSPATRLLMTLFDVRLGLWMGNTRDVSKWKTVGPRWGIGYLFSELFGQMGQDSGYMYLSDGGHFENLGVYELIRRHCRLIIASDASCDRGYRFEGLLDLIEKARTDFGATIVMNLDKLRPSGSEHLSRSVFAVGTIYYDPDPHHSNDKGVLIYLKASMPAERHTRHDRFVLPPDVWKYHTQHSSFPHQSTADQWFDETQFESYRALGEYVGDMAAERIREEEKRATSRSFFDLLRAVI